jgi:hypothetical protein
MPKNDFFYNFVTISAICRNLIFPEFQEVDDNHFCFSLIFFFTFFRDFILVLIKLKALTSLLIVQVTSFFCSYPLSKRTHDKSPNAKEIKFNYSIHFRDKLNHFLKNAVYVSNLEQANF